LISGLFSLPFAPAVAADVVVREHAGKPNESFIAGPENALVRSLAAAVSDSELRYNPIVLYGPAGAGKSSLAHALAARRREQFGLSEAISTTAADLARALAHAVETASVADLRARHHRCDLLLVDDVHRLAGKAAAQQFLLTALDALVRRGSLVIVTLRQPPHAPSGLSPPLVSRLLGGLVVGLALPGPLARRELVRQAATQFHVALGDDDITRLAGCGEGAAERFLTAARLRQAVLRLSAKAEFGARPADAPRSAADESLRFKSVCRQATVAAAKHFGLTMGELKGKSRRQVVADARGLAMYVTRLLTGASYAEIVRQFGNRDHTTVLHACRKVAEVVGHDEFMRHLVDDFATQIASEGAV